MYILIQKMSNHGVTNGTVKWPLALFQNLPARIQILMNFGDCRKIVTLMDLYFKAAVSLLPLDDSSLQGVLDQTQSCFFKEF